MTWPAGVRSSLIREEEKRNSKRLRRSIANGGAQASRSTSIANGDAQASRSTPSVGDRRRSRLFSAGDRRRLRRFSAGDRRRSRRFSAGDRRRSRRFSAGDRRRSRRLSVAIGVGWSLGVAVELHRRRLSSTATVFVVCFFFFFFFGPKWLWVEMFCGFGFLFGVLLLSNGCP